MKIDSWKICHWPILAVYFSVEKEKVNKWEFCKLKITNIVVFVIVIRRIFPFEELYLAPTHSMIVIWELSIHLFSFINEVGDSCE